MTKVHIAQQIDHESDAELLKGVNELLDAFHEIDRASIRELVLIARLKDDASGDGDVKVGAVGNAADVLELIRQSYAMLLKQFRDLIHSKGASND